MLSCWCANPESRPLFDSLEKSIGKLLENGVAEHYIDLNEPYLKTNVSCFTEGQTDYLALMAAPDCPAPAVPIPNYVNGHISQGQPTPGDPSYLAMNPSINSPMPDGSDIHDEHFRFPSYAAPSISIHPNVNEQSRLRGKPSTIPEEIPMLKRSNQSIHSDSDTDLNTSDVKVHTTPDISTSRKNQNTLNTSGENYVNVPSTIINMNKNDSVSNPGYIVVSNINETRT